MSRGAPLLTLGLVLAAGAAVAQIAGPVPIPRLKPSIAELSNFALMPETTREAMIRALATRLGERLEADPGDVEGWLRLAQVRLALDERPLALTAFERALALAPRSPSVVRAFAAATLGEVDPATGEPVVGEQAFALYRRLALIVPGDRTARWYLGLHALQAGDPEAAAAHWRVLLRLLPPEDPEAEVIRQRLESLHPALEPPSS